MSPLTFLARPERWLWAIHKHGGTLSAAPNFAYDLCLKRIDDRDMKGLDLSSWRIAANGAEPVIAGTIEGFCERFAEYGFRRETIKPVYGLAECSVGLAFPLLEGVPPIDRIDRDHVRASRGSGTCRRHTKRTLIRRLWPPTAGSRNSDCRRRWRELPQARKGGFNFAVRQQLRAIIAIRQRPMTCSMGMA